MIRLILTFHLAAILLFSNVGIPAFKHICHSQGKTWSSVIIPAKSCCSKKKLQTVSQPCHSNKSEAGLSSRPCCENQQDILQLDVDYLQGHLALTKSSQSFDFPGTLVFNSSYDLAANSNGKRIQKSHGPPQNLYGRSLLITQQVFRC